MPKPLQVTGLGTMMSHNHKDAYNLGTSMAPRPMSSHGSGYAYFAHADLEYRTKATYVWGSFVGCVSTYKWVGHVQGDPNAVAAGVSSGFCCVTCSRSGLVETACLSCLFLGLPVGVPVLFVIVTVRDLLSIRVAWTWKFRETEEGRRITVCAK